MVVVVSIFGGLSAPTNSLSGLGFRPGSVWAGTKRGVIDDLVTTTPCLVLENNSDCNKRFGYFGFGFLVGYFERLFQVTIDS